MTKTYTSKALLTFLSIIIFGNSLFGGDSQMRDAKKNGTLSNSSIAKTLDSSIASIADEIERVIKSGYTTRYDSLRLRELSSRMSFLAGIASNIRQDDSGSGSNVQQDLLSISILVFGFLLMILILLYQFKQKKEINPVSFKLLGLLFIGTLSVFLIPAGFDNNQITPVVGLLGTLAGYLIGTAKDSTADPVKENK